jgi:transcriptional regulator with XRE-family HTH domain
MMCERAGVSKQTYQRTEKGDPTVSMGVYAMCLFVLGLDGGLADLADPRGDDSGLLFDEERVPKRIRATRAGGEGL